MWFSWNFKLKLQFLIWCQKISWPAILRIKHAYALIQLHSCFELAQTIHWVVQTKFASLTKQTISSAQKKLLLTWQSMWQYNILQSCLHRQDQNTHYSAWKPTTTYMFDICTENMNKSSFKNVPKNARFSFRTEREILKHCFGHLIWVILTTSRAQKE